MSRARVHVHCELQCHIGEEENISTAQMISVVRT